MDSRLLWGVVEMLLLEVISHGPTYGYEIAQAAMSESNGYFDLKEGSLYPALHRLEEQKYLSSFWREVEGRRRKYYQLSAAGAMQVIHTTGQRPRPPLGPRQRGGHHRVRLPRKQQRLAPLLDNP
jgi:PadR family transcriptional regulator